MVIHQCKIQSGGTLGKKKVGGGGRNTSVVGSKNGMLLLHNSYLKKQG